MALANIPHKNLIASGIVALLIIGIGVYAKRDGIAIPDIKKNTGVAVDGSSKNEKRSNATENDSDGDGLFDWEENLKGSDPFTADTDGDGTFDGLEIASGRDPNKKGPDDKIPGFAGLALSATSTDLNGIKQEYFEKYLTEEAKKVRTETFRDIIKSVKYEEYRPTAEIVDLNIISDASLPALREYGNAFGRIIQKHTATPLRTEEEIFAEAMKAKTDDALADLQYLIVVYTNFAKDLKAIPVPIPLAEPHKLIVNGYEAMAKGLRGMQHLYSDPINGAAGYQAYTYWRHEVIIGYAAIVAYFITENVTFTSDEPGYPFYYNTMGAPPDDETSEISAGEL